MKRLVPVAMAMSMVMLLTMFASCSTAKKENNVVKEDDPWYESTRFEIKKDVRPTDQMSDFKICTSDERLFSVYCYTRDMWATTKTVLDTYDFEGNLLSHQKISCPEIENFRIMRIYSIAADPDGKTLRAAVWYNSLGDPQTTFIDIDTESGLVSNIKDILSPEVEKDMIPDASIFDIVCIGDYKIVVVNAYAGTGFNYQLLLFKKSDYITELDLSTVNLSYLMDGLSIDYSTDSLYATGYENAEMITMVFDLKNGNLKNKTKYQASGDDSINFAEYKATDKGDLCKIDSLGNIMKIDVNTMTPVTMIDTNWYTPFFYPSESDKYSVNSTILSCNEDRTVIWDYESTSYGTMESYTYEYVRVLNKADKNPHAGKKIIELALPVNTGVTDYLAKAIYEFNKTDDEYHIRVWDKYKTGFVLGMFYQDSENNEQQVFKMIQDLKGDDAPDLAIGIQKNYAMRDEVFMDLSGFLDPEVLDKQYNNIFEAGRINGKLYFLPITLEIEGLVTSEEMIKGGAAGITFEEYDELVNEEMHGFSPYDYPNSYYYNKRDFLLSCIDTKSAIEGENIEFGTDQFRAAAEYAKENFVYDDDRSTPEEYLQDWNRYRGKCYYTKIDDYLDYVHACYNSKGRYIIIGTPSVDASGPRFKALETISVSATTDVTDGCKKFINYLFSGAAYNSDECAFRQIVTNKDIMNKNIDTLTRNNNDVYGRYKESVDSGIFRPAPGLDKAYGDKIATDDMRECFLDSLSTISTYYYEDYTIVQFALEELAPYYAGDRSLEDVIKYLNDRTAKYVREM